MKSLCIVSLRLMKCGTGASRISFCDFVMTPWKCFSRIQQQDRLLSLVSEVQHEELFPCSSAAQHGAGEVISPPQHSPFPFSDGPLTKFVIMNSS